MDDSAANNGESTVDVTSLAALDRVMDDSAADNCDVAGDRSSVANNGERTVDVTSLAARTCRDVDKENMKQFHQFMCKSFRRCDCMPSRKGVLDNRSLVDELGNPCTHAINIFELMSAMLSEHTWSKPTVRKYFKCRKSKEAPICAMLTRVEMGDPPICLFVNKVGKLPVVYGLEYKRTTEPDVCDALGPWLDAHYEPDAGDMLDELSSWFLGQYEREFRVDAKGQVKNFVSIKEVLALCKEHDVYKCMKAEDRRRVSAQTIKTLIELNAVLKPYFKQAKKVKLAETGNYNNQAGIIHYKRKNRDTAVS
jgi:hypothetical protein